MPRHDLEWKVSFFSPTLGTETQQPRSTLQVGPGHAGSNWYVPYEDSWGGKKPIFLAAQEAILEAFGLASDALSLDVLATTPPHALGTMTADGNSYYTVKRVTSFVEWIKRGPLDLNAYYRGERLPVGWWTIAQLDKSSWRWRPEERQLTDLELWRTLVDVDTVFLSGWPRSFRWKSLFLAHSSDDKAFVRRLAMRLGALGVRVWVDEAEIKIGESLFGRVEAAIDEMDYIGVVLSRASVQSPWVKEELRMALARQLRDRSVVVLPLLLEDTEVPGFLREKKYADFRGPEAFESALGELVARLREDFRES